MLPPQTSLPYSILIIINNVNLIPSFITMKVVFCQSVHLRNTFVSCCSCHFSWLVLSSAGDWRHQPPSYGRYTNLWSSFHLVDTNNILVGDGRDSLPPTDRYSPQSTLQQPALTTAVVQPQPTYSTNTRHFTWPSCSIHSPGYTESPSSLPSSPVDRGPITSA